ncbi:MAG: PEGA domain-containing protein [Deltaproteobacteria bacterium]|nr:PEGA domain-containing protein [Deltaproteobacteria bacterium]
MTAAIVDNGTSEPVTAEVRVDGKALEDTAPLSKELLVGTYRLEVRAEGAHPFEQTVEVREGETQTVTALLAKMLPAEVLRLREPATGSSAAASAQQCLEVSGWSSR